MKLKKKYSIEEKIVHLETLASYLDLLPSTFFDMSRFWAIKKISPISKKKLFMPSDYVRMPDEKSECGAVGCAIGHFGFAMDLEKPAFMEWRDYFNLTLELNDDTWDACFSGTHAGKGPKKIAHLIRQHIEEFRSSVEENVTGAYYL